MKFVWKIGGEAGFGIMTTGLVFTKIINRLGYYTYDYVQYPSLIRGGHNTIEVVVSDSPVYALAQPIDFLICLNKETYDLHKHRLHASSVILYDKTDFEPAEDIVKIDIPFKTVLKTLNGQAVMVNTIALGASLAVLGSDMVILNQMIEEQFKKKGEEVISFNKKFAEEGFNHVKNNYAVAVKNIIPKKEISDKHLVMSGNEAFSLGSVIADCRLYSAYPMTPSSSVLTTLAAWQEKTGMVVRHAEDEISVINTALGASFAGIRSAVGTSGGGFALMVESLSFAGIAEMPVVVFLAQRPGPATGMPTWTEQGDLLFAVHAGHGEFPKIVLAPGDMEEMILLTAKAFNLADIYQIPVIVMSDMLLSESHKTVSQTFVDNVISQCTINRGKIIAQPSKPSYLRYKLTDDGISERLIPGAQGYFYQENSYEHDETGHTIEDAEPRMEQVEKRAKKMQVYMENDFMVPRIYGNIQEAQTVFVSWGSQKGIILEAQTVLKQQGKETAFIHFNHLYPLSEEKIRPLFEENKRYILIENNATGQLGKLLRQEIGIDMKEKILRYDGRTHGVEEIIKYIT